MKNEVSTEQQKKPMAKVQAQQRQTQAAIARFDSSSIASQLRNQAGQARDNVPRDDAAKD